MLPYRFQFFSQCTNLHHICCTNEIKITILSLQPFKAQQILMQPIKKSQEPENYMLESKKFKLVLIKLVSEVALVDVKKKVSKLASAQS